MEFEGKYIDELIEYRREARLNKDWALSDEIRSYLDTKLVFVFDSKFGQEIYHLTEDYFKPQLRKPETISMSRRQYVEYKIKEDINANNNFNSWLYSASASGRII